MGFYLFQPASALTLVAATPAAGYVLVNGTGTVISWTTPNDGNQHYFLIATSMHVTSGETGGLINQVGTLPDSTASSHTLYAAGLGSGEQQPTNAFARVVGPNTTVSVTQASALTGGAATLWAAIWGA